MLLRRSRFAFRFGSRSQPHPISNLFPAIVAGNSREERITNECRTGLNSLRGAHEAPSPVRLCRAACGI